MIMGHFVPLAILTTTLPIDLLKSFAIFQAVSDKNFLPISYLPQSNHIPGHPWFNYHSGPICWSRWPSRIRRGSAAACFLALWVRIPLGHGCPSVMSVVCCQVEVSASGWSPLLKSPTECVCMCVCVCVCVCVCGQVQQQLCTPTMIRLKSSDWERKGSVQYDVGAFIIKLNYCLSKYWVNNLVDKNRNSKNVWISTTAEQ